jgi:hypothetical protein
MTLLLDARRLDTPFRRSFVLGAFRLPQLRSIGCFSLLERGQRPSANFTPNPKPFMPKMRAAQIARPGGPLEIVEREIPEPGAQ